MPSILIADDDASVRRLLRTVLEDSGHHVWEASDGKEAATMNRNTKFDLAIVDLVMPEQEGLETIQALRKGRPGLRIIVMSGVFTGVHRGAMLRIAEALGAKANLPKPFSVDKILEIVQRVLDSPS